MFKKMIIVVMAIIVVMSTVACTSADAAGITPETVPGIIGLEHIGPVMELNERYINGEFEDDYRIDMVNGEGYWVVYLEGESDAYWNQAALGIYDHMPNEEEINILWNNRVVYDVIDEAIEEFENQKERP